MTRATRQKPLFTLAQYIAQYPNAKIASGSSVRLAAGVGAPHWNNFLANTDCFEIGFAGFDIRRYVFERW